MSGASHDDHGPPQTTIYKVLPAITLCGGLGGGLFTWLVEEELVDASFTIEQDIDNAAVACVDSRKGCAFALHPDKAAQTKRNAIENRLQFAQWYLVE